MGAQNHALAAVFSLDDTTEGFLNNTVLGAASSDDLTYRFYIRPPGLVFFASVALTVNANAVQIFQGVPAVGNLGIRIPPGSDIEIRGQRVGGGAIDGTAGMTLLLREVTS